MTDNNEPESVDQYVRGFNEGRQVETLILKPMLHKIVDEVFDAKHPSSERFRLHAAIDAVLEQEGPEKTEES